MEARNRSLQQSVNTEIEFLDQGKRYSIWYDYDYDSNVDPGEKTFVELEQDFPGVYIDYNDDIAFDARGFLSQRALIDVATSGSSNNKKKVIEVSIAGTVKVQ